MLPDMNDEITRVITGDSQPAYVYTTSAAGSEMEYAPGGQEPIFVGFSRGQTAYAVIEPGTVWRRNDEAIWDGRTYIVSGVALRRDIDGQDHHVTLTLEIPDAST